MFHKEGLFSHPGGKKGQDTPLRKTDRRKLRDRFISSFYVSETDTEFVNHITTVADCIFADSTCDVLERKIKLPGSGNSSVKFYLRSPSQVSDKNSLWPYHNTTQPILIEMDHPFPFTFSQGKNQSNDNTAVNWNMDRSSSPVLIPTVALLSVLNIHAPNTFGEHHLPTITIPRNITKYLCRGAHLMRAGMSPRHTFMPLQSDDALKHTRGLVALRVLGNPQPFASGFLSPGTTLDTLEKNVHKGIGVFIVTCYGDDLWREYFKHMGLSMKFFDRETCSTFEDGSYGNPGFLEGRIVCSLKVDTSSPALITDSDDGHEGDWTTNYGVENATTDSDDAPSRDENISILLKTESKDSLMEKIGIDIERYDIHSSPQQQDSSAIQVQNIPANTLQLDSTIATSQIHDHILLQAFYHSLLNLKKADLPILISTYYSKFILPNIPPDTSFDLKFTTYKKLGPFLREQVDKGVISLGPSKDGKDPFAFLTHFNKTHDDLKEARKNIKAHPEQRCDDKKKLTVVNLYTVPPHFVSLLGIHSDTVLARNAKSEQRRGTGFLTASECRDILEKYLVENNRIDPQDQQKVVMNGPLCDALFKNVVKQAMATGVHYTYPERLYRKDLHEIWLDSLDDAFAIVSMPGSNIVTMKRGQVPKIQIEVTTRQGNKKFITRVRNLEEFGIIPQDFCNDVSKRFACAGTIDEDCIGRETLKKGYVEVVFQGNLSEELNALLTGDESVTNHGGAKGSMYCIPKLVIQIKLLKGVKKSKS